MTSNKLFFCDYYLYHGSELVTLISLKITFKVRAQIFLFTIPVPYMGTVLLAKVPRETAGLPG